MTSNLLKEIGIKYRTDKADHGYLDVYYDYFSSLRFENINILEIGIYNASSIMTWREFFPNAQIIGMDIEDKASLFNQLTGPHSFHMGDQGDRRQLMFLAETVKEKTGKGFDIIIDDGSHFQHDLMVSFGCLFPYVNNGGLYILEDMCRAEGLAHSPTKGCWWGSPDENHHMSHLPGIAVASMAPKQWLPNGKKDLFHCAETTMERLRDTGTMTNAFLTAEECQYITKHTAKVAFYKGLVPPISGASSLAVASKV